MPLLRHGFDSQRPTQSELTPYKPSCAYDFKLTSFPFNSKALIQPTNPSRYSSDAPITKSDVKSKALTGPGGSLTSAFNAPSTTNLASFL